MGMILSSEFCFALLKQKLPAAVFAEVKELPISYVREIYAEVLDPQNMLTDFEACWVHRIRSLNQNSLLRTKDSKWANAFSELNDSERFLQYHENLPLALRCRVIQQPIRINFSYAHGYAGSSWDYSCILRMKFEGNINRAYEVVILAFHMMKVNFDGLPADGATEAIILPVYLDLLRGTRKI